MYPAPSRIINKPAANRDGSAPGQIINCIVSAGKKKRIGHAIIGLANSFWLPAYQPAAGWLANCRLASQLANPENNLNRRIYHEK